MDYLKQNPHNLKTILDFHYKYQGQRRKTLQQKGTTSNLLQTMARKKIFTYGPQVKLLMDVVGETVDKLLQEDSEEINDDNILDLVPDVPDDDNFQDTTEDKE